MGRRRTNNQIHRNWWVRVHGGAPNWLTVLALLFVAAVAALYVMDPRTEPEPTWTPVARESASPDPSIAASPEG